MLQLYVPVKDIAVSGVVESHCILNVRRRYVANPRLPAVANLERYTKGENPNTNHMERFQEVAISLKNKQKTQGSKKTQLITLRF